MPTIANCCQLSSCTIATVIVSCLLSPARRMSMEHLQNATLAGGVAVGACADLMLTPGGAATVGAIAGALSTLGFKYVQVRCDNCHCSHGHNAPPVNCSPSCCPSCGSTTRAA